MQTLEQSIEDCRKHGQPTGYFGERGDWMVVLAAHRDSDSLSRSNFRTLLKMLGGESSTVVIERFSHWAVGWVDYILIKSTAKAKQRIAAKALADIEQYPVLDEEDWSQLQSDEFYSLAKSELKQYPNWETVLYETEQELSTCQGDDSSEWECIEAAKAKLESAE